MAQAETNETGHVFCHDDLADLVDWIQVNGLPSKGLNIVRPTVPKKTFKKPTDSAVLYPIFRVQLAHLQPLAARKPNWSPGTAKPLPKFLALADWPMMGMKPHEDLTFTQSQLHSSHQSLFHVYIPCFVYVCVILCIQYCTYNICSSWNPHSS